MMSGMGKGPGHFEMELQLKAQELVSVLNEGDLSNAMEIIQELHEFRHQVFFSEVGHLTRGLHEAIKAFSHELGNSLQVDGEEKDDSDADAADRLNYVIEVTEKNAHETMDRVDKALSLVDKLDSQSERFKDLLLLVGQLEKEHDTLNGVYDRTCAVKEESEQTIEVLRTELTDILVSQSYQDITGQLIRRVINLVTNVESHLVGLMEMAAKVEKLSGIDAQKSVSDAEQDNKKNPIQAEGPQVKKDSADVVSNQDEVDDLLSSLGF
ncbi:protein phosphatase CheZ [Neptuniibacter sp.]|uniref:protein phosphatase CheZ n=1 Tax=Neptuniibacter sp. TaxID=1962643 RepID=UPI00262EBDA0|nr:protein phosphatase CheZ [Neptuniibacter sp.]MCP4596505.1 protein phosphatase CheZ [Neptuniibacter sp.]